MSLSCVTCGAKFPDIDSQRKHYKTEWHTYNIKRKLVELPSVTFDFYKQKVDAVKDMKNVPESSSVYCAVCGKHFGNQNALENHSVSRKHQDKLHQLENLKESSKIEYSPKSGSISKSCNLENEAQCETSKVEEKSTDSNDDEEWDDDNSLGLEECLFCSHISANIDKNLQHMFEKHSFFLPDAEYLTDVQGLVSYLDYQVGAGNECIWCRKTFRCLDAVQKHMCALGHTKLLFDDALYVDFYDYSSSYPDNLQVEAEIEDSSVISSSGIDETLELVLPSGAVLGHRSLWRYFRQRLPPERALVTASNDVRGRSLAHMYRALGWLGSGLDCGPAALLRRAKDQAFLQRRKQKHFMGLGIRANKLQHHFRHQNPL